MTIILYCLCCSKMLVRNQEKYCSVYCTSLHGAYIRREQRNPSERNGYLKLNSSNAAYKEAIKLINL